MNGSGFAGAWLVALAMSLGLAACGSSDPAIKTLRVFDMIAAYSRATATKPSPDHVSTRKGSVGKDERNAIFMHAPAQLEFPAIEAGVQSEFTAMVGIDDKAVANGGDGVEFVVNIKLPDDSVVKAYSRLLDPRNEQDRTWIFVRVALGSFANQQIKLILSTTGGPKGDLGNDWGLWADPRIVLDSK